MQTVYRGDKEISLLKTIEQVYIERPLQMYYIHCADMRM